MTGFHFDLIVESHNQHRPLCLQIEQLIASITLHYTIHSCKTELDEIRGLSTINFLDLMLDLRSLFVYTPQELSVEAIQGLFVPIYSLQGSNSRNAEEAVMMLFMELLFEMASKYKVTLYPTLLYTLYTFSSNVIQMGKSG